MVKAVMQVRAVSLLLALAGSSALAADPTPASPPDGWTRAADGTYAHSESGVICPAAFGPYKFARLDGPSAPTTLGVCVYSGGDVRVGEIRVRKFVDGVGETPLAIQNDRGLMGVAPVGNVPAGSKPVAAMRGGPGPTIDGTATAQLVITSVMGGLMVDCISQTKQDKDEQDYGFSNFVKACMPKH
ncbi:MAG TPA: hypothetical protein VGG10_22595 [Rhizomicrobium sp.]|jgi:hypothetical protein